MRLSMCLLAWPASAAEADHRVLLLLPENAHVPFFAAFVQTLGDTLQQASPRVELQVEALPHDLLAIPAQGWFDPRVAGKEFSALVTVGAEALQMASSTRTRLWPKQPPIVFTGLTQRQALAASARPRTSGSYFDNTITPSLALGMALFPGTRHLAVVGSAAATEPGRGDVMATLAPWRQRLDIIDLTGQTLEELRQRVAALPAHSLVLMLGPAVDRNGRWLLPRHLLSELAPLTPAPFFSDAPAALGHGAVGGALIDASAHGHEVALQVLQQLEHPADAAPPPPWREPAPLRIDWRALQQHGVPLSRVPAHTDILFRPPTVWEAYRGQVAAAAAVLLLQSALVTKLVLERRQRRRAQCQAQQRLAELAHFNRLRTVSALSLTLAHEMNQPLGTVLSAAQTGELLLARPHPPLDEVRAALDRIVQATERATNVVRSLRQLSHKAPPTLVAMRLDALVAQTVALLDPEAALRQITLTLVLQAAEAEVRVDRAQCQQVLINLLLNAMEAMQRAGTPRGRIQVATWRAGDEHVGVQVDDVGPGLPSDDPQRVFTSFYTTRDDGLGLGLGIARDLVQSHGGTLRASQRPGGGARFTLRLPLAVAASALA